jgi:hypothetical protein
MDQLHTVTFLAHGYHGEIIESVRCDTMDEIFSILTAEYGVERSGIIMLDIKTSFGKKPPIELTFGRKVLYADDQLLQALRNVTREYIRLAGKQVPFPESINCVQAALKQLKKHKFKQDKPFEEKPMDQDTNEFEAYSVGICAASVCTSLTPEQAAERLNETNPTGIASRWEPSKSLRFHTGEKNGCDCPDYKGNHHYLMQC